MESNTVQKNDDAQIKESIENFRKTHYRQHANDTEHFDHFYKSIIQLNNKLCFIVILTGDAGVGKSNFLLRYL